MTYNYFLRAEPKVSSAVSRSRSIFLKVIHCNYKLNQLIKRDTTKKCKENKIFTISNFDEKS